MCLSHECLCIEDVLSEQIDAANAMFLFINSHNELALSERRIDTLTNIQSRRYEINYNMVR